MGWGRSKNATWPLLFLLFAGLPAVSSVAWAAEYPRRIAIAPFAGLGPPGELRQAAGGFCVAAAPVDEITPRLGALASDISEKIFGVKTAVRTSPPPTPVPPPVSPPAIPAPAGAAGAQTAVLPPAPALPSPLTAATPPSAGEGGPSSPQKL